MARPPVTQTADQGIEDGLTAPRWTAKPPPVVTAPVHGGVVGAAVDLTTLRGTLHRQVMRSLPPQISVEDVDRLLLSFEELASNGLRHGRPPIEVTVFRNGSGWLIDVTDSAIDSPPAVAVDRDPAEGGLGLHLVARLSAAYGWWVDGNRKHVWALVETESSG